ncbi:MAG: type II toxin-antitoxin system VapC family toxin [Coraliomargarita sp.]
MAFLIDTNVLSEIRRKSADEHVLEWQAGQDLSDSWLSVLTLMEIRNGTERVRKADPTFAGKLDVWYDQELLSSYEGRVLPVTLAVCETRAAFPTERTLPEIDALIGATAKQHDLTLVTRNVKDFQGLGIDLVNPWEHPLS